MKTLVNNLCPYTPTHGASFDTPRVDRDRHQLGPPDTSPTPLSTVRHDRESPTPRDSVGPRCLDLFGPQVVPRTDTRSYQDVTGTPRRERKGRIDGSDFSRKGGNGTVAVGLRDDSRSTRRLRRVRHGLVRSSGLDRGTFHSDLPRQKSLFPPFLCPILQKRLCPCFRREHVDLKKGRDRNDHLCDPRPSRDNFTLRGAVTA